MARSTAAHIRAMAMIGVLALAGCDAGSLSMPFPQNRVGTNVSPPENTVDSVSAREQVEPDYIPSAEELVGADGADVEAVFGVPSLARVDQDAQVWQYRTEACVLFLFFYPDENQTARVSYVTSSGARAGVESPGDQACVEAVTRAAANDAILPG